MEPDETWIRGTEAQIIANECRETLELADLLYQEVAKDGEAKAQIKKLPFLGSFSIPDQLDQQKRRDVRHAELAAIMLNSPARQMALGRALVDRLRILSLIFYPKLDGLSEDEILPRTMRTERLLGNLPGLKIRLLRNGQLAGIRNDYHHLDDRMLGGIGWEFRGGPIRWSQSAKGKEPIELNILNLLRLVEAIYLRLLPQGLDPAPLVYPSTWPDELTRGSTIIRILRQPGRE